ncbi:hypothetical protein SAMN05421863_107816 [Nitrosomonas communis]|uniref:Uncharacterized protein n=1 Tax=Nitrosomonas communis TaxID=44574 RepID=A0A1I4VA80_9PROT|nr:hypothetical protein SAMN05421863_107816 [Nitrosomonas communis]
MRPNAAIVAHADLGRINEADPTALPKAADQKTAQGRQATLKPTPQSGCSSLTLENNPTDTSRRNSDNSA